MKDFLNKNYKDRKNKKNFSIQNLDFKEKTPKNNTNEDIILEETTEENTCEERIVQEEEFVFGENKKIIKQRELSYNFCCNSIKIYPLQNGKIELKLGGYDWSHSKKMWVAISVGIVVNTAYSLLTSLILSSLSAQRTKEKNWQITYGIASFVMNFPLAFISGVDTVKFFRDLGKRPLLYKAMTTIGFILAFITTLADIPISYDGIYHPPGDIDLGWVKKIGVVGISLFAIHTLTTRFVKSAELLYGFATHSIDYIFCRRNLAIRNLYVDIQKYGYRLENNEYFDDKDNNRKIAAKFYNALQNQQIQPNSRVYEAITTWIVPGLVKTGLLYATYLQFPVWLDLSQRGVQEITQVIAPKISLSQETTTALTYLGAVSTEMFFVRWAWNLLDTVVDFVSQPYKNKKFLHQKSEFELPCSIPFSISILLLGIGGVLGWFSGEDIGEEMKKTLSDIASKNTTQVAHNFYQSSVGTLARVLPTSALLFSCIFLMGVGTNAAAGWQALKKIFPCLQDKTSVAKIGRKLGEDIEQRNFTKEEMESIRQFREEWMRPHHEKPKEEYFINYEESEEVKLFVNERNENSTELDFDN